MYNVKYDFIILCALLNTEFPSSSDGSILACLCETDYCNIGTVTNTSRPQVSWTPAPTPSPAALQTSPPPRRVILPASSTPLPVSRSSISEQNCRLGDQASCLSSSSSAASCPLGFQLSAGGCFFFSEDRVGWIEARKMCGQRGSILATMETRDKRQNMLRLAFANIRRRREDFWLAGNDIEVCEAQYFF